MNICEFPTSYFHLSPLNWAGAGHAMQETRSRKIEASTLFINKSFYFSGKLMRQIAGVRHTSPYGEVQVQAFMQGLCSKSGIYTVLLLSLIHIYRGRFYQEEGAALALLPKLFLQ